MSKIFNASIGQTDTDRLQKLFTQQAEMDQKRFETLLGLPHSKKRPTPFRMPSDDKELRIIIDVPVDFADEAVIVTIFEKGNS